jgi:hypothetical protein
MIRGTFLPPNCVTRVTGQDSQQQRERGLNKISQHENSTFHTNINVASWVTKCKQYKQNFMSYALPQIILFSRTSSGMYFFMARQSLLGIEIKLTVFSFSLLPSFKLEILSHNRTHNYTSPIYITPQPFTPGSGKQAFRNIVGGQILTVAVGLGLLIVEASSYQAGVYYTGVLYTLVASQFNNSF